MRAIQLHKVVKKRKNWRFFGIEKGVNCRYFYFLLTLYPRGRKIQTMATVNILTSSFNGKLGAIYGTSQYKKKFVKAVPFSHSPHNLKQTASVRAFEVLNRISATLGKTFFDYLSVSDKNMSKMNAIAHLLKPTVQNNTFNPNNLSVVFGESSTFSVLEMTRNPENSTYYFNIANLAEEQTYTDSVYFIGIFNALGNCKGSFVTHTSNFSAYVPFDNSVTGSDLVIILRCIKRGHKYIPFGFFTNFAELPIIDMGIMYCSRFDYPDDFSLSNGILSASPLNFASIENNIILITQI